MENEKNIDDLSIDDVNIDLIKSITVTEISEYINYLVRNRKNNNKTLARKESSLKTFFKYLTNKAMIIKYNPTLEIEPPKIERDIPMSLNLEQCIELLNSVDGDFKERDYCIITLFLNCGLKLSELVNLNISDINKDIILIRGKENKEREIYLNKACKEALNNYINVRNIDKVNKDDNKALFISRINKRMGRQAIQNVVNKYLNKIGIKEQGYSVQNLRHTAATLIYKNSNIDIRDLKDILGHEHLGSTEIYATVCKNNKRNLMESTPLSKITSKTKRKN